MSWKRWMAVTLVGIIVGGQAYAQGEVETWTQVRGVDTPGTTYSSFIQTDSGRLLAAGRSGQLMLSDDGGTTWEYRVIRVDDEPFFGLITDMIGSSSRIDAVAIRWCLAATISPCRVRPFCCPVATTEIPGRSIPFRLTAPRSLAWIFPVLH